MDELQPEGVQGPPKNFFTVFLNGLDMLVRDMLLGKL